MPQNATSINGDYVAFLTTHLSLVHVITLDDLIGTDIKRDQITKKIKFFKIARLLKALLWLRVE